MYVSCLDFGRFFIFYSRSRFSGLCLTLIIGTDSNYFNTCLLIPSACLSNTWGCWRSSTFLSLSNIWLLITFLSVSFIPWRFWSWTSKIHLNSLNLESFCVARSWICNFSALISLWMELSFGFSITPVYCTFTGW